MKNVLITGGAGFIAHHLIGEILKKTDWSIYTIDRLDFSGNLNRIGPRVVREPLTPVSLRTRDDGKSSGFLTSIEKGLRAFGFFGSGFCFFLFL